MSHSTRGDKRPLLVIAIALAVATTMLLGPAGAGAAAGPQLEFDVYRPDTAQSGDHAVWTLSLHNMGEDVVEGPIVFEASFPPEISVVQTETFISDNSGAITDFECTPPAATLSCTLSGQLRRGVQAAVRIEGAVDAVAGSLQPQFAVSAPGAVPLARTPTLTVGGPEPFSIKEFTAALTDSDLAPARQAASHNVDITTRLRFNAEAAKDASFGSFLWTTGIVEHLNDIHVALPPGLVGNPRAVPQTCTQAQLSQFAANEPLCPRDSQIGIARINPRVIGGAFTANIYSVEPPFGHAAAFGFNVSGVPILLVADLRPDDHGITVSSYKASTTLPIWEVTTQFWGVPEDPAHDGLSGTCKYGGQNGGTGELCPSGFARAAFLRLPTSCPGTDLAFGVTADTHEQPGQTSSASATAPSMGGCDRVPFDPGFSAQPTTVQAETPSGLEVSVSMPQDDNPDGLAQADVRKAVVTLPQGLTVNPSQAEGLGVCSPTQFESTELSSNPTSGKGCPDDSKIGTVAVHTPLLEETIPGDVYVAKPFDNPFNTLIALYVVLREPQRGILLKLSGKVDLNAGTGQITTTFDDLPQLPFSSFDFHFREGPRAPLSTPAACGTYTTHTELTPWSDPSEVRSSNSSFEISQGIAGGPCPSGGTPPFRPGFSAGSLNNNAGSYSPFYLRLSRNDGEQEITRLSAVLPPGVLAKLAGVSQCPEAAIAAARANSGVEETAKPSCPASSEIGRSLVGAGVGSVRTHIPGRIYLGGPFHGEPLSAIAITPALAGPFDVGTVVVHEAITLNPNTAEVEADGSATGSIPPILRGVPTRVRDLRVYLDRPEFTLNPTSCDPSSTRATLFGSGSDPFDNLDDTPVAVSARYQAASCQALGFKPRLLLRLKGGTKRSKHPALTAVLRPRLGNASAARIQVALPHSEFLAQSHIRTICTRVQFAAAGGGGEGCPQGSVYGKVTATSPLVDYPLTGNVYLRSSTHPLPDMVLALKGPASQPIEVYAVGRIDSDKRTGGIRTSFETLPDAPLTKVVLRLPGGKKSLLENSTDICRAKHRATVRMDAHNGRIEDFSAPLQVKCDGKKYGRRHAVKR